MTALPDPLLGREVLAVAEEVTAQLRIALGGRLSRIRQLAHHLHMLTQTMESLETDMRIPQFFALMDQQLAAAEALVATYPDIRPQLSRPFQRVSAKRCIEQAIECSRVPKNVRIEVDAEPGDIQADPIEVAIALRCLIENAAEAMAGNGVVRISACPGDQDGRFHIVVVDTGPGFSRMERDSALHAFHSTKVGHAGLGLNMAQRVAQRYGGRLVIDSADGYTRVALDFPVYIPHGVTQMPSRPPRLDSDAVTESEQPR